MDCGGDDEEGTGIPMFAQPFETLRAGNRQHYHRPQLPDSIENNNAPYAVLNQQRENAPEVLRLPDQAYYESFQKRVDEVDSFFTNLEQAFRATAYVVLVGVCVILLFLLIRKCIRIINSSRSSGHA